MTSIYQKVAALISDAAGSTFTAGAAYDYTPSTVSIPAVEFSTTISGATVPDKPTFTPSAPPITDLTGDLDRASYSAVSAVVGSLEVGVLPITLGYETPEHAGPMPDYGDPAKLALAPETSFVSVESSAGLTTITAPDIAVGRRSALLPIPQIDFTAQGLEPLELTLPEVIDSPEVTQLENPEELVVALDPDLLAAIKHTLGGQDITPIQDELYQLAIHDERFARTHAERELFSAYAALGFSDAGGALFEGVADLNFDYRMQEGGTYEQGRDEVYALAKDKLVEAVQQSIALETANFAVHLSYASKLAEVFSINATLHLQVFNTIVTIYNAQLGGVDALIGAYNAYVGANITEQEAEAAALQATDARLQTNRAEVQMYRAQAGTENARIGVYEAEVEQDSLPIEEYSAYIDGLLQNVRIMRYNIDAYRGSLQAYAQAIETDKSALDAYQAHIRTEGSAVDLYRENWELYDVAHRALSQQNSSVAQFNRSSLQALQSEIGVFRSAAEGQNTYLRALTGWLDQRSRTIVDYRDNVNRMVSYMGSKNSAVTAIEVAEKRILLGEAEAESTQSALDAQRDAAQATIDSGLLTAETTTYAGLAQAAYSIRSISASLGSGASDADSRSYSEGASEDVSYSRSYSYTRNKKVTS